MFVDEAQDLGPSALQLLNLLVKPSSGVDSESRPINIFYDNAQNLYGRGTPRWADIGIDMVGRSTVMEESFRSTKPIAEFALNVLYRLDPQQSESHDHRELVKRGLVEPTEREGDEWWEVRYNQTLGPAPSVRVFDDPDAEFDAIGKQLVDWIREEGVHPNDICVLYNSKASRERLESRVQKQLQRVGAQLEVQTGTAFTRDENTVIASTAQSFKGYESEIVVVAGADQFLSGKREVLPSSLYVAMTRARSILAMFATRKGQGRGTVIVDALERCRRLMHRPPAVHTVSPPSDEDEAVDRTCEAEATGSDPVCQQRR
jgi:superfamily I DNA/RNA helicase